MKIVLAVLLLLSVAFSINLYLDSSDKQCSYDPYQESSKCNALCEDIYHRPMESYDGYNRKCLCNTER